MCSELKALYKKATGSDEFTAFGLPGYSTFVQRNQDGVQGFFTLRLCNGKIFLQHFLVKEQGRSLLSNGAKLVKRLKKQLRNMKVNVLYIECPVTQRRTAESIYRCFDVINSGIFKFRRIDGNISNKYLFKVVI